ncbi:Tim44-like domain-containing protein [Methylobacter sp. Wu1]|uniref:Tim44 domain-containing protein n=1 Tax=Methylobacter sp. Wu1 TaxID=3119359 RepID=UPI002F952CE1
MNRYTGIVATLLIGLSLSLGSISDAEAKRFGGGSSFGGRSSFSQPYKRSADAPARSATQQQQQQQAAQQNQTARSGMANRGGLMGLLGGLALGGLLGSLLAGGAFQGINFLDILVLGALAFMLYKFFAAKKAREQQPVYDRTDGHYDNSASAYTPYQEPQSSSSNPSGFDTDILFKKDKPGAEPAVQSFQQDADFGQAIAVPAGFDTQAFLAGAKTAFKTLQKAWDDRDLAEIRGLTTDKVFAEIQDQLKASSEENRTDVLKLDAELLEVREVGSELQAVVLFDVIMREDADAQASQVREVWHFIKPKNSIQPSWYLDGIQQLED